MLSNEIELESFVEEKIMELMNLTLKGLEFNPNGPRKCLMSLSRDNIPPSVGKGLWGQNNENRTRLACYLDEIVRPNLYRL